jgi:hypothetical protein
MTIACPALGPRSLIGKPWRPLTDQEFAHTRVWLPCGDADRGRRGRALRRVSRLAADADRREFVQDRQKPLPRLLPDSRIAKTQLESTCYLVLFVSIGE